MPAPVNLPPVLYEDDSLVAFDKPSGLPVAAARGERAEVTLMDLVRGRYGGQVANVHRLDAGASGVVLCAKTKPALDFLSGQFQSKTVRRVYRALVAVLAPEKAAAAPAPARAAGGGLPAGFSVDLAIGDDDAKKGRMRISRRAGRPSLTHFAVLEPFGRFAWIECRPETGRTHQVRVHLAAAAAPVLNDPLYGDADSVLLLSGLKKRYKGRDEEKPLLSRLALHAGTLGFTHPLSREPKEVSTPTPGDFENPLKYLRKFHAPGAGRGAYATG